jgi:hypothetical protein
MVDAPAFIPALMEEAVAAPSPAIPASPPAASMPPAPPVIEIEAGMFVVRLRGEVDGRVLATVLCAVKAAS